MTTATRSNTQPQSALAALTDALRQLAWGNLLQLIRQRFAQARLGVTASSLTYTTVLALVPTFTVFLAVFAAFPAFRDLQNQLQLWLLNSLVPDNIAKPVMGALMQFSAKASKLGAVGLVGAVVTAIMALVTIETTLNEIWRVREDRPWAQRILLYWTSITLGPLLLGASLLLSSTAWAMTRQWLGDWPPSQLLLVALNGLQLLFVSSALMLLYRLVPNTHVEWRHAAVGGLVAALALELAKKLLTLYLSKMVSFSAIYGTFATVPILLLWIYMAWVLVLVGALVAAILPEALQHLDATRMRSAGWRFDLALRVLRILQADKQDGHTQGITRSALARQLKVRPNDLSETLSALMDVQWVGELRQTSRRDGRLLVLLVLADQTPITPLAERLLLAPTEATQALHTHAQWQGLSLAQALAQAPVQTAAPSPLTGAESPTA